MKYGKTYSVLLPSFPKAWQERAISYRKLKKLINNTVDELSRLGLDPTVLNQLLHQSRSLDSTRQDSSVSPRSSEGIACTLEGNPYPESGPSDVAFGLQFQPHAIYEVTDEGDGLVPRLRLWVDSRVASPFADLTEESRFEALSEHGVSTIDIRMATVKHSNTVWGFPSRPSILAIAGTSQGDPVARVDRGSSASVVNDAKSDPPLSMSDWKQIVVILTSDARFYQLLQTAIRSFTEHQQHTQKEFSLAIERLTRDLSNVTHPSSRSPSSDLYPWRRILRLWIETEIFESSIEKDRGERDVESAERRLVLFADEISKRGLDDRRTLKNKDSSVVLERFLHTNTLLLELKKFQRANEEAARKILKKHEKRTALILPSAQQDRLLPMLAALLPESSDREMGMSLAHILVVQLTEVLLPVIPFIEDYECLVCASIAYIPIRLRCSHLFCVRCLVKMQKRGLAECPLCRSPTVLQADRTNIDAALRRFMMEWFPVETKDKAKANQREAAEEELREMGFNPGDDKCLVQ